MNCLKCNFENSDTAQFCDGCGILLYESFKAHLRKKEARSEEDITLIPTQTKKDVNSMFLLISLSLLGIILFIMVKYKRLT